MDTAREAARLALNTIMSGMGEHNQSPDPTDSRQPGASIAHSEPVASGRARSQSCATRLSRADSTSKNERSDVSQALAVLKVKYESLKEGYRKVKGDNERLREQRHNLKSTIEFYAPRYGYIVENFAKPYALGKDLHFDDRNGETIDFVMAPMLQDAKDVAVLEDQVQNLQRELLNRERNSDILSDDQFTQEFRKLASQIKTLSRQMRPQEEVTKLENHCTCTLSGHTSRERLSNGVAKKMFIEAWIWSALYGRVFGEPFSIFTAAGGNLVDSWCALFGSGHFHGWPAPSKLSETWRYTTIKHLVTAPHENGSMENKVAGNDLYLNKWAVEAQINLIKFFQAAFMSIASDIEALKMEQIVSSAFTLAMHMWSQRCRLQITFPSIGDRFAKAEMTSLPNADDEEIEEGIVIGVVNPGLTKWGDGHGKNLDQRYDIVPSLVQVEPSISMTGPLIDLI